MTELAVQGQYSGELSERANPSNDLVEWAYAAKQAHAIAVSLAGTAFVSKSMQGRPDEVCGAILAGRELGMSPMNALRSIDIIDGTPALRAVALRGLVQNAGHRVYVQESTEHRAIVCGQRKGEANIETSTWTMDRAKKANLAHKKNWVAHPTAMLVARATSEVCRLIAADVLLGMPYSAEELGDGGGDDAAPTQAAALTPVTRRTAARAKLAKAAPPPDEPAIDWDAVRPATPEPDEPVDVAPDEPDEPAADDEPTVTGDRFYREPAVTAIEEVFGPVEVIEQDQAPDVAMISDAQRRRLGVGFKSLGIADREERLTFASMVVGRDLESSNDLTMVEATRVIGAIIEAEQSARDQDEPPAGDDG